MKGLLCFFGSCKFVYNFSTMPNKCICKRCHLKFMFNLNSLEWEPIDVFENETRTDEQLIKTWVKTKTY